MLQDLTIGLSSLAHGEMDRILGGGDDRLSAIDRSSSEALAD